MSHVDFRGQGPFGWDREVGALSYLRGVGLHEGEGRGEGGTWSGGEREGVFADPG